MKDETIMHPCGIKKHECKVKECNEICTPKQPETIEVDLVYDILDSYRYIQKNTIKNRKRRGMIDDLAIIEGRIQGIESAKAFIKQVIDSIDKTKDN